MRDYHEQLRVPATWWLLAIPVCLLFGGGLGEMYAGSVIMPILIFGAFTAAVVAFLLAWGMARIDIGDGVIRAGGAELPVAGAGQVMALDERQSTRLRGPRADPAARLLLRPYLKRAVYIAVTDPASPHPYWLLASRKPEELAAAIERCRETVG